MNEKNDLALVRRPPSAVEKAEPGAKRILSGMVADTLALAKDATIAHVDLDALVREGKRLYRGEESEEDWQARKLFLQAAEAGHSEAQFLVYKSAQDLHRALQRFDGELFQIDKQGPIEWLRKSAESGFGEAQFELGKRYYFGDGLPQDYEQAVYWYRKAAEQGNASAQETLGDCYFVGKGVWDYEEAVEWYRKAADQDYALAQCGLGVCYGFGKGVTQDFIESAKWFRKAAENGDAAAQFNLGYCYEHGQGVAQDFNEAVKWYRKAADQGHTSAQKNLGACYANGRAAIALESAGEVYKWVKLAEGHGCEGAAKTAAVIEALLSPEEFLEAERRYRKLMASH